MANQKKTWFLVPGWDVPPSAIRLGHIIANPTEPRYPPPLSPSSTGPQIDTEIFPDVCPELYIKLSGDSSNTLDIWAQFLQFVGLTAEVKLRLEEGMEEAYSFEKPKTKWFSPSPAFAKASMESAEARDFLDVAGTRTPLYMVTGVKVVTGGSITTTRNKGHAYDWEFGVDGTPVGAPVLAGPYFERTNAGLETSYRKETPIVVAYQLMQVKLKDSTSMATPYSRGAISEFGDGKEEELMEVELSDISLEPGYKHEEDQEEFLDGAFTLSSHAEGSQDSCVVVVPDTIYVYGKSDIESGAAFNAPLNIGFISRNISGPSNASNFEKSRENFEVVRSSLPEVQANENRTNDGKLQMWYGDIIAKINDALSNGNHSAFHGGQQLQDVLVSLIDSMDVLDDLSDAVRAESEQFKSSPRSSSPVNSPPATGSTTARPSSPKPPGGPAVAIRRKAAADRADKAANARPSSTRAAGAGGSSSTMLRLYTDESPGLKVDPVVVLVLSVGFIISVVALHVIAKITKKFSA
ncbi:Protein transport protein Sec61 subunit beta [Botryosphaeria dothidea]|uniref:Protein transport protein Sec61 subunit beta n=1 Tax=Botryosphaeria dothidea TaxID=55169 RepID=A0A8H4J978_9PEZI|nr:Protein transport protein Sec61 subunit beta [Botryosphaeria dothidea]